METDPVLSVRQLAIELTSELGPARVAAQDISFEVRRGSVLGVLGESGSGKSLIALALMRLLPPGARVLGGEIVLEGRDLLRASSTELQSLRGSAMAIIFQEPATALSPVHSIAWHLELALRPVLAANSSSGRSLGLGSRRRSLRDRATALLGRVEVPDPAQILDAYPFQLSAGMRRRVLIAMALARKPHVLIADEPTTGLDAPLQAQMLDLLSRLVKEEQSSAVFISHDPEVLAEVAHDLVVLHAGEIVEVGPAAQVLADAQHPYTRDLIASVRARRLTSAEPKPPLDAPGPLPGAGCRFLGRCSARRAAPARFPRCAVESPRLEPSGALHRCRCFYSHAWSSAWHE